MSKMSDMAMTIEELRSAATAINEAASWLATQFGGTTDEAPAKEPAAKEEKRPELKLDPHLMKMTIFLINGGGNYGNVSDNSLNYYPSC